jgi:hypothetical protein
MRHIYDKLIGLRESYDLSEVDGSASKTLTIDNVKNTIIHNVGQGNANINLALPEPNAGYNFRLQIGEPSLNYVKVTAPTAGTMIVDGVPNQDAAVIATPTIGNFIDVYTSMSVISAKGLLVVPTLNVGTIDAASVLNATFTYYIAGLKHSKDSAETALGTTEIPINLFGAVALDIDATGTITVVEASANATGYATAPLAIAGIAVCDAAKIRLGTVTVKGTAAAFTLGTTLLNAADTTVAFATATTSVVTDYAWCVKTGLGTVTTSVPS